MSDILGMPIREGKWRQYLAMLDRDGKITKKTQMDMILALCETVAELEDEVVRVSHSPSLPMGMAVAGTENYIGTSFAGLAVDEVKTEELNPEEHAAAELKKKRQANMKKAQDARRQKYELKRATSTNRA